MNQDINKKFLLNIGKKKYNIIDQISSMEMIENCIVSIELAFFLNNKRNHIAYKKMKLSNVLATQSTELEMTNDISNGIKITQSISKDKNKTKFKMIHCAKGNFLWDTNVGGKPNYKNEKIEQSFLLGETEVTQELYDFVMGVNPSQFNKEFFEGYGYNKDTKMLPVSNVSWVDAVVFCNKLSEMCHLQKCYQLRKSIVIIFKGDVEHKEKAKRDERDRFYESVKESLMRLYDCIVYYDKDVDAKTLYSARLWLYYDHLELNGEGMNSIANRQKKEEKMNKSYIGLQIWTYNLFDYILRDRGLGKLYEYEEKNFKYFMFERIQDSCKKEYVCDLTKNGYRLPLSKEWIYAAKANTKNKFSGTSDEKELLEYAWIQDNVKDIEDLTGNAHNYPRKTTQPVATKKPNEWGFYDMNGNVWEWCNDRINLFDKIETSTLPNCTTQESILYSNRYCNLGGSYYSTNQYAFYQTYYDLYIDKKYFVDISSNGNLQGIRLARTIDI